MQPIECGGGDCGGGGGGGGAGGGREKAIVSRIVDESDPLSGGADVNSVRIHEGDFLNGHLIFKYFLFNS